MDYRLLGRSGLKVPALTLGTMTFGGGGNFNKVGSTDTAGARRQIDMCRDAGVTFIDTADVYSAGESERIVGEALKGRRSDFLVATKVRFPMGEDGNDRGLSRHHIVRACENSLKRLNTDYIDLYQCHQWDGMTPLEETLRALDDLVEAGKVRYVGVSNYSGWHLMKALGIAERDDFVRPVSQQIHYTLQSRDAENELVPIAVDQGVGILVWSPLAGGLLSGKYRRGRPEPANTRRAAQWTEPPVYDTEKLYDVVEVLCGIAEARGVSAAQVSIAWLLTRPGVASVIIGARTDEQLADNLKAAELSLSPEEVAQLEEASRPDLQYPYWHQRNTASDRLSPADLALISPYLSGK